jgi:hypothetical protein
MAEGIATPETNPERESAQDFTSYVDMVADQLEFKQDPYMDRGLDLSAQHLLSIVDFKEDATPVDLKLKLGSATQRLHSDSRIPQNPRRAVESLELYALTAAKLKFAEKHAPNHASLLGFSAPMLRMKLQRESAQIIKTGRTPAELHAKNRAALKVALGTMGFLLAACASRVDGGTVEIPTVPPTATEMAGETDFFNINETAAIQAIALWQGKDLGDGQHLSDNDANGFIDGYPYLNQLSVANTNENGAPAGHMSVVFVETNGTQGKGFSIMILRNEGMGAQALAVVNAEPNQALGTVVSELVNDDGEVVGHLAVNINAGEDKPWASAQFDPKEGELAPAVYDLFAEDLSADLYEEVLSGGKPLFSVAPISVTPTAESPTLTPTATPEVPEIEQIDLTPKSIPLMDYYGPKGVLPLEVSVASNALGAGDLDELTHPKKVNPNDSTLASLIQTDLAAKHFNKKASQLTFDEWSEFATGIQNGTFTINVLGSEGAQVWKPSPENGYTVNIVAWEDAAPTEENGFSEWKHPDGRLIRSKVFVDEKGDLVGVIATQASLETLTDAQLRDMLLYNLADVLLSSNQEEQSYVSGMAIYGIKAGEGATPYIKIGSN